MNERIRELAEQAAESTAAYPSGQNNSWETQVNFMEKFAELIVRECMLCCERVISDPVPESVDTWLNGGTQCIAEIKLHFGVEE
jgi:hypothetical protein